jgi:hypothetical protein
MLTISKLKRWSINYYIDTAQSAEHAARDLARTSGGLGEYYSERETRTPVWLLAGDTRTVAGLVGLTDAQRAGGDADSELVAPPKARAPLARTRPWRRRWIVQPTVGFGE